MARATTAKKVSFSGRRRIRKFFGHITEAAVMHASRCTST